MILKTTLSSHLIGSKIEITAELLPVSFPVIMKTNYLIISTSVVFWPIIYIAGCVIFLYFSFEIEFQLIHHKKINAI